MRLNRKIIIVFLMLSVFALGTLNFVDTVEAAKWKKHDSGKFTNEYPAAGYKKVSSYQSYIKGNNEIYVDIYDYSKNGNNKKLTNKIFFTKKNNNILKVTAKNYFSNEKDTYYYQAKWNVKAIYKDYMNYAIKGSKISPEKKAFDKQSFTVNNNNFKVYSVKYDKDSISVFIYKNNEEYCTFDVYKEDNKIIYKEYNQKRKLVSKESFKLTQTVTSIYKNKLNKNLNKIKSTNTVSGGNIYNDGYVSFNYPTDWKRFSSTGSGKLASFETSKGDNSIASVFMSNADGISIEEYRSFNEPSGSEKSISSKYITINGVKGFDVSLKYYTNSGGEQKIVGFIKKGIYYKMIFTTGSLNAIASDVNMIINSFKAL